MRSTASRGSDDRERGSAVVEFSLVAVLIAAIFMVVVQVGVVLHLRNVAAGNAQAAARYGANANVDTAEAAHRAQQLMNDALPSEAVMSCTAIEEVGAAGLREVVVSCVGELPSLVSAFGPLLPVSVTARAVKEGQ